MPHSNRLGTSLCHALNLQFLFLMSHFTGCTLEVSLEEPRSTNFSGVLRLGLLAKIDLIFCAQGVHSGRTALKKIYILKEETQVSVRSLDIMKHVKRLRYMVKCLRSLGQISSSSKAGLPGLLKSVRTPLLSFAVFDVRVGVAQYFFQKTACPFLQHLEIPTTCRDAPKAQIFILLCHN